MSRSWATVPMEGKQFGFLTVIRRAGSKLKSGRQYATWHCRCECGQQITVIGQLLRRGVRKSCAVNGHFWREKGNGATTRHSSEYNSWRKMWDRCTDAKQHGFKNYGGRGITVCARWKSFKVFLTDMGVKPDPKHTIDRRDVNGNYEPGNCRWASRSEQYRNTTRTVYVTYQGKRQLLIDVVAGLGISRQAVYGRLKKNWSLESALATPVKRYKKK